MKHDQKLPFINWMWIKSWLKIQFLLLALYFWIRIYSIQRLIWEIKYSQYICNVFSREGGLLISHIVDHQIHESVGEVYKGGVITRYRWYLEYESQKMSRDSYISVKNENIDSLYKSLNIVIVMQCKFLQMSQ